MIPDPYLIQPAAFPMETPRIGDRLRFKPGANVDKSAGFGEILGCEVTGTVVLVNEAHRWARYAYETPQGTRHECFKF